MRLLAPRKDAAETSEVSIRTPSKPLSLEPGKRGQADDIQGEFVTCRVDELQPHPSYVRNHNVSEDRPKKKSVKKFME